MIPAVVVSLLGSLLPGDPQFNQKVQLPSDHVQAPPPRVSDQAVPAMIKLPVATPDPLLSHPLTADEAAQLALLREPSIKNAIGLLNAARGITQQSGANLSPQLIGSLGANTFSSISGPGTAQPQFPLGTTPSGVSPVNHYSSALELRQLLFDFDQTRNQVRLNQALVRAAESNLTRAQQDLAFNVKAAFYNLEAAEELVRVNDDNVANRQKQLDLANARLKNGIGQPSDVVTAETAKSQGLVALNQSRDQVQQSRITLLVTMGFNPLTPITTTPQKESSVTITDPNLLLKQGLDHRPEVKQARSQLEAQRRSLSVARALNLPAIYVSGAIGSTGNTFPLSSSVAGVAVGLSFPILDGGQRAGAIKTAQGDIQTAEANLQTTINIVESDIAGAYAGLLAAEQRVTLAESEVTNAREGVRLAEGRYAEGFGQFQDIITAQGLLVGALTDQANAVSAVNIARTHLRHALGVTLTKE